MKITKSLDIKNEYVFNIELSEKETLSIIHSLSRSMCKGEFLDISMELEDKLSEIVNNKI